MSAYTRLVLAATFLLATPWAGAAELPPELRSAVDRLISEVERAPSDRDNAVERMAVLWRWANAVSLDGGFVPKNLPLAANYVPHPTPGTEISARFLEAIDLYTRELAFLEQDPRALGALIVEPPVGPPVGAVARSWQTLQVRFEVGSLGVAEGGGFLVSRHIMGDYSFQVDDPTGDNLVTIASDRVGVTFELDEARVWGPYGGFRAPQPFPVFRVRGGRLRPGDIVTLTYGDRSGGGRGFQVGSFSNSAIALPLHLDPGDGRFYEMPPATFRVIGGEAAGVHGFAPSIVAAGERFEISVRSEDEHYNRATSEIRGYEVLLSENGGESQRFSTLPAGQAIHTLPITLDREGVYRFSFRSLGDNGDRGGSIQGIANPIWVQEDPEHRILWGETHGHCGFAEGQGTVDGYFEFARDDARLDFVTLSEHDIWLTDGEWQILADASKRFQVEGKLAVYPGYEWSAQRQRGGHHNVFFRTPGMARVGVQSAPDLSDLYRGLRALHDPRDVLIIPHAHQAGDWRLSDHDMEHLVEIMSSHGTFEWFGQRYLEHGHQVGFVGASDDHIGHPGYAPGHPAAPGRRSNIFQFGGLAGAYAERSASGRASDVIFDALKARSAYATSGSQRIILEARLNGHPIGAALDHNDERTIEGRAIGTAPIRAIELIKNSEVIDRFEVGSAATSDPATGELVVGFYSESEVHLRDNPRGHRTWTGSLEIEGATLKSATFLGTPNRTADQLEVNGNRITFDVATRGSRRTVALTLDGASEATSFRFDLEPSVETGTAPIQIRAPDRFPAESFTLAMPSDEKAVSEKQLATVDQIDRVTIERAAVRDDVEFRFSDRGRPGDWYYVRVEQVDGHLAWTSPWWVGGEPIR